MTPYYKIIADGVNITAKIETRLMSLSVSDAAGMKSDAVEIRLDDRDNDIELPAPGALLIVFMGYKETGLVPMGAYTVDEVTAKGAPDTVTIQAKAAHMGGSLKSQKTRNWDEITLEGIAAKIAPEHSLQSIVSPSLASVYYDHLDQTDESDMNFLTRITQELDALATVKGEHLLITNRGEGLSADGTALPPVPVHKSGKLKWSATFATRDEFKSVEATWVNTATGGEETVTAGEGSPVKKLRQSYSTKDAATRAANGKLAELTRGNHTFSVTMTGNPLIAAEGQIEAIGFRQGVSGRWSVKSARHQIAGGGFTTSVQAEKPKITGAG